MTSLIMSMSNPPSESLSDQLTTEQAALHWEFCELNVLLDLVDKFGIELTDHQVGVLQQKYANIDKRLTLSISRMTSK